MIPKNIFSFREFNQHNKEFIFNITSEVRRVDGFLVYQIDLQCLGVQTKIPSTFFLKNNPLLFCHTNFSESKVVPIFYSSYGCVQSLLNELYK